MTDRIYLDHAATSPLRPEAEAAMREGFALWANPSSPHAEGRKARAALEDARERIKAALGWDGELIFTSGASEAADIALDRSWSGDDEASQVEHDSILRGANGLIAVRADGSVDIGSFEQKYGAMTGTPLYAIQDINSETGNRQDFTAIVSYVSARSGLLLVDSSQSAAKFPLVAAADLLIVSAHKFGGPVGIGALLVRDLKALLPAGGQERGYRRGTENLPGVLGMMAALEASKNPYLDPDVLTPLDAFANEVRAVGGVWLSDCLSRPTPYIRAIAMPSLSGSAQVMRFDMAGIAVSQGSACSSGSMKPSHVLAAMGLAPEVAARTIRVSFGWNTKRAEVERFCETWLTLARAGEGGA